MKSLIEVTWLI